MKRSSIIIFGIFIGVLFVNGAVWAHENEKKFAGTAVHMTDEGFEPREVTISQGDTVIFENNDDRPHWPASNVHPTHRGYPDSDIEKCGTGGRVVLFDACEGIPSGGTFRFRFEYPGTWKYHDHLNPRAGGTVIVTGMDAGEGDTGLDARRTVEPQGDASFVSRFFSAIKGVFTRLYDVFFGWAGSGDTVSRHDSFTRNREPVANASPALMTDRDMLRVYVKEYGAAHALEQLTGLEREYGSCHDTAHYVGRYAFEFQGTDAFRHCVMQCQSGCFHGVAEEFFRRYGIRELKDNLNEICTGDLDTFKEHQCYHGVGHGLMAWSNYELLEALRSCDLLENEINENSCYSGVFMENIAQSMAEFLELEGHSTKYLSDDPHFPCTIVDERHKGMCYYLQTDQMLRVLDGDFSRVAEECASLPRTHRIFCFRSMGRSAGARHSAELFRAVMRCETVSAAADRAQCIAGLASNTLWDSSEVDDALYLCGIIDGKREKDMCYDTFFFSAPAILDAESYERFCRRVEPHYQERCMELR